ncbi:uncharacterized protein LOC142974680 [Anticarsia gemmatalis]|uniref:uncharacterized protein LOC142974680 n=1 Tax=Anticarsia gemmatalis TaxID=129554 RepID=UPI003F7705A9
MDICRICLSKKPEKDVCEMQVNTDDEKQSKVHIMMFCLGIEMEQDSKISTKLCLKCYRKLVAFQKFKALALKSDVYLRSLDVKSEVFITEDDVEIKSKEISLIEDSTECKTIVKVEPADELCLKTEDDNILSDDFESDDELLSVIKKIKYEYVTNEVDTTKPTKVRQTKGIKHKNKHRVGKQMCEECGKTVSDLKAHSLLHLPPMERKLIPCRFCDKKFTTYSARYKHNKFKHLGQKSMCTICNKEVSNLRQHRLIVHEKQSLPYECVECKSRFICKSMLDLHTRVHTKDKPFTCDICDKPFSSKGLMNQHKRSVHDKEKSHLCQLCSKSFFKKYHLQKHLQSHTKEKRFECPDCGKFYKTVNTLKGHRETHGDVRNFACNLCDQTFMKKEYLSIHMVTHTKVKRYPCQYCGVKFHRSDHRRRHEFTAHQKHLIANNTTTS